MSEENFIYIIDSLRGAFILFIALICFDIVVTRADESLRRWYLRFISLRPCKITETGEEDVSANPSDSGMLQRRTNAKNEGADGDARLGTL